MSQKEVEKYLEALSASEMTERERRSLPATHVLDMADYPFRYARAGFDEFIRNGIKVAKQEPDDAFALMLGVYAAILSGDYAQADAFMETYSAHPKKQPLRAMRFTRRLDAPQIDLPPVEGEWPTESALFVSCDPAYLKYALPLLRSVADAAPHARVHLHLMGRAEVPNIPGLTLSTTSEEIPSGVAVREYLGAVRLSRFAQALEASNAPLIMVDADALATADHRRLFSSERAGLRIRAGRVEPWTQFSACCIRGTPQSLTYFRAVADIVNRTMNIPFWGMDQYALFAAYIQEQPELELFGPGVASVTDDKPGVFWFTAGNAKLSLGSDSSPYAKLFQRYSAG